MLKHLIFDFDGTVVDSADLYINLCNEMADELKVPRVNIESLKELANLTIRERCKKLNIPLYRLPFLSAIVQEKIADHIHELKWVKGMEEEIIKLKSMGYDLKIISSNTVKNILSFFENNNPNLFKDIYSSKGIFNKHRSIKALLKKYKIKRDEAIYIGDEYRDIKACKKAKIRIIAVTWGYDPKELLIKGEPDFIADTPSEMTDIIRSIT
ncbi:MAG TPA: HAD hydrolase-like protein [Clostridiaceae bacterium]|nr:HAD hydrolase-like protein [Clostridiaceae bacterium]